MRIKKVGAEWLKDRQTFVVIIRAIHERGESQRLALVELARRVKA
jgi:hypothetical protein